MKKFLVSSLIFMLSITSCNRDTVKVTSFETIVGDDERDNAFAKAYYKESINSSLDLKARLVAIRNYEKCINSDSLRIKALMQKTFLFSKQGQIDSAIFYTNEMQFIAMNNGNNGYIGRALLKLGGYSRRKNNIEEAFEQYNKAYLNFKTIKDSLNIAKSLLAMSKIQKATGDFIGSKITAIDGLRYLASINDTITSIGFYQNISVSLREEKNLKKSLEYNIKALNLSPSKRIDRILNNSKANILADQGNYNAAIAILQELKAASSLESQSLSYARIIDNLGYILWKQDAINSGSEKYLIDARTIRLEKKNQGSLIASNIHLAKYYATKNVSLALSYAEDAFRNAQQTNSQTSQLEALDLIIKLKDNPKKEALLYASIDKKLTNINQKNRELYSVTKYENEELLKQNLIAQADNLQKEKLNNFYLSAFIILVLTSTIVYILLKNRHSREKQYKVIETESRISKKIHDELANDVYSTMVQLENKTVSIPEIITNLEGIYHNARYISQEKTIYSTNEEYVLDLKRTLGSFSGTTTNVIVKGLKEEVWIDISQEKKVTALRVLKELLVNMKKHSKASIVSVIFSRGANELSITYTDNGIWVHKNDVIDGTGLINAENRIQAVGGKFIFDTSNRKGLKITIEIPL